LQYDTVIVNGRWFDGTGAPSARRNIIVRDGRVATITPEPLDTAGADVIDATGQWVIAGIIDIHTHYDVEILCEPELSESLRHGVTTVMLGSCSLSTVYLDNVDAGDIFGREEAIPRRYVIEHLDAARSWSNPAEYVAELDRRNLGPNVAAFMGHSGTGQAEVRPLPARGPEIRELDAGSLILAAQRFTPRTRPGSG
jgi:N-acyl-D-aspartate/D-glutamate deacylase